MLCSRELLRISADEDSHAHLKAATISPKLFSSTGLPNGGELGILVSMVPSLDVRFGGSVCSAGCGEPSGGECAGVSGIITTSSGGAVFFPTAFCGFPDFHTELNVAAGLSEKYLDLTSSSDCSTSSEADFFIFVALGFRGLAGAFLAAVALGFRIAFGFGGSAGGREGSPSLSGISQVSVVDGAAVGAVCFAAVLALSCRRIVRGDGSGEEEGQLETEAIAADLAQQRVVFADHKALSIFRPPSAQKEVSSMLQVADVEGSHRLIPSQLASKL